MQIEVLDYAMSCGKSQGLIQWMKDNPQNRYIYVSPLLSEVEERIPSECAELGFISPNTDHHKRKSDHLLELLKEAQNISFTHSLFVDLTKDHLYWIRMYNYVLIIDEEVNLIEQYDKYTIGDIVTLEKEDFVRIDAEDLGRVIWQWEGMEENTKYSSLRRMCELQMVYCAKRDKSVMVVHLPIELITSAGRVIVSTYLFEGSVMDCFVRMKGISVKPFNEIKPIRTTEDVKQLAREKIHFIPITPLMAKVRKWQLTKTWWKTSATEQQVKEVGKAIRAACRNAGGTPENTMWTIPKGSVRETKGKRGHSKQLQIIGYASSTCFVPCSCKATNSLSHKTVLVHAYNRYPPLGVESYLQDYGFPINRDQYATSELLQWVWRSAIRNGEDIQLCILNQRMQDLILHWLKT